MLTGLHSGQERRSAADEGEGESIMRILHLGSLVAGGALVLGVATTPAFAQRNETAARYTAVAVDMNSPSPGLGAGQVNLVVNRWSDAEDETRLMDVLVERGGKALLSEMERWPEVGSVAGVGSVGFSVRYAWHQVAADGTERVTMITPRPMSFSERWNSGRSTDYPFLIVQMELQPDGKGTGSIIIAAQLFADKVNKSLVVDTLLDQPILLQGLERLQ